MTIGTALVPTTGRASFPALVRFTPWLMLASVLALTVPLLYLRRSEVTGFSGEVENRLPLAVSYAALVAVALLSQLLARRRRPLLRSHDLALLVFLAAAALSVFANLDIQGLFNFALFCGIFFGFRCLRLAPRFRLAMVTAATALGGFLAAAWVLFAPPQQRWLGGIHPNILGGGALAFVFFSRAYPRLLHDLCALAGFALVAAVSSRFAMLAILTFYLLDSAMNWSSLGRTRRIAITLAMVVAAVMSASMPNLGPLGTLMEVNSVTRGLDSGMTGRDTLWANFWPQISEYPLTGTGFRNRDAYLDAHNGFLNVTLETGLIGGTAIILYILSCIAAGLREVLRNTGDWYNKPAIAGLAAISLSALLQPQLINFGDPFGFLAIFVLATIGVRPPPTPDPVA